MAGIRIVHPTQRNATLTIVDASRPYTAPVICLQCATTHQWKTYHILVDDVGAAIVSLEVFGHLARIHGHGFRVESEVIKPPPIGLGIGIIAATTRIMPLVKAVHHNGRKLEYTAIDGPPVMATVGDPT